MEHATRLAEARRKHAEIAERARRRVKDRQAALQESNVAFARWCAAELELNNTLSSCDVQYGRTIDVLAELRPVDECGAELKACHAACAEATDQTRVWKTVKNRVDMLAETYNRLMDGISADLVALRASHTEILALQQHRAVPGFETARTAAEQPESKKRKRGKQREAA